MEVEGKLAAWHGMAHCRELERKRVHASKDDVCTTHGTDLPVSMTCPMLNLC